MRPILYIAMKLGLCSIGISRLREIEKNRVTIFMTVTSKINCKNVVYAGKGRFYENFLLTLRWVTYAFATIS